MIAQMKFLGALACLGACVLAAPLKASNAVIETSADGEIPTTGGGNGNSDGDTCKFPFSYGGVFYSACTG